MRFLLAICCPTQISGSWGQDGDAGRLDRRCQAGRFPSGDDGCEAAFDVTNPECQGGEIGSDAERGGQSGRRIGGESIDRLANQSVAPNQNPIAIGQLTSRFRSPASDDSATDQHRSEQEQIA